MYRCIRGELHEPVDSHTIFTREKISKRSEVGPARPPIPPRPILLLPLLLTMVSQPPCREAYRPSTVYSRADTPTPLLQDF